MVMDQPSAFENRIDKKLLAQFLWQHDEAGGGLQSRRRALADWHTPETRSQLHVELLRCDLSHACAAGELRLQLPAAAAELGEIDSLITLCRRVYEDAAEIGVPLSWVDFSPLGLESDRLQLLTEGDPFYLGARIADRFAVEQRVGHGGFGVVYQATDATSGRRVAVKGPRGDSPKKRSRAAKLLHREAEILQAMNGEGTPRFVDFMSSADGAALLAMEFVEGRRLSTLIGLDRFAAAEACELAAELCDVINRMHQQGFVHRDLKPDNIVVRPDGRPCLLDMGVAFAETDRFQQEGFVVGTLHYMPPEGLLGIVSQLDGRSDVWALGALLYELLAGTLLQQIDTREAALVAACTWKVDAPEFPETTPEAVRQICLRCLARDPNERFNTAAEAAEALRRWLNDGDAIKAMDSHRLAGWRLGMKLDAAAENQGYMGLRLQKISELSPVAVKVVGDDANNFGYALLHGMGLATNLQELGTLAAQISHELPAYSDMAAIQSKFYARDQSTSAVKWLRDRIPQIREHLEQLYSLIVDRFRQNGDAPCACCEAAASASLLLLASGNASELDETWRRTGLDEAMWNQFKREVVRPNAGKQALTRLDKNVESSLLFGLKKDDAMPPISKSL